MAKTQQGYLPDKKTGVQRFMPTDPQDAYELREARSEISRHHRLIEELRDGLDWALCLIAHAEVELNGDDFTKYDHYRKLLNRQVS